VFTHHVLVGFGVTHNPVGKRCPGGKSKELCHNDRTQTPDRLAKLGLGKVALLEEDTLVGVFFDELDKVVEPSFTKLLFHVVIVTDSIHHRKNLVMMLLEDQRLEMVRKNLRSTY